MHVCNEVQEFTYILSHTLHGCCCALWGMKTDYPLGGFTAGFDFASYCFMRLILIRSTHTLRQNPYPRQRGDHVLLDDGGFCKPCTNICTHKLKNTRAGLSILLRKSYCSLHAFLQTKEGIITWISSNKFVSGRGDLNLRACRSSNTTMRDM